MKQSIEHISDKLFNIKTDGFCHCPDSEPTILINSLLGASYSNVLGGIDDISHVTPSKLNSKKLKGGKRK